MSEDYYSIDKRLSILEVKYEAMNEAIEKIDANLEESYKVTLQIKERLDKWNGNIPHMASDVKELKETLAKREETLIKRDAEAKETSTKTKILWGIVTTIGGRTCWLLDKSSFSLRK